MADCGVCRKTGNCQTCGGTGEVVKTDMFGNSYTMRCLTCDGKGACSVCGGTGQL